MNHELSFSIIKICLIKNYDNAYHQRFKKGKKEEMDKAPLI